MSLPSSQFALFLKNHVPEYTLKAHPVPTPGPGEVLIKVEAVALNPTDWKLVAFRSAPLGNGAGNDFSGTVVALGPGSHEVSVGDNISGRVRPGSDKRNFAFQQYVATRSDLLIKLPSNISFEQGSTLIIAGSTALVGVRRLLDFPRQTSSGKTLLVSGGSTCVGMYACQLARLIGVRVIATASPKNFDLLRSLGAASVIDYRVPDARQQILDAAGPSGVDVAFDAASLSDSVRLATEVVKANPRGRKEVGITLPVDPSVMDPTVEYPYISVNSIYGQGDYQVARTVYKSMTGWLEEGKLQPSPVTLMPGGLNRLAEGLALLKEGKVSASKVVYRVADTTAPDA